jgi:predicted DNA-binding transcriptional regulator AlpA
MNSSPVSPALPSAPVSRFSPAGGRKNADAQISSRESVAPLAALQDLQRPLSLLPAESIPEALGVVEAIRAALWLRVNAPCSTPENREDRLLTAAEAARVLSVSEDTVYGKEWPFTVRIGHSVRFSAEGIQEFLRSRRRR